MTLTLYHPKSPYLMSTFSVEILRVTTIVSILDNIRKVSVEQLLISKKDFFEVLVSLCFFGGLKNYKINFGI